MQENKISVKRTARYFVLGDQNQKIEHIYIAFHGYGQLASIFAKKFDFLAQKGCVVIVPEALSRFYLDDQYQRIGASWITREMRDDEVKDSLTYINDLLSQFDLSNAEIHLFGFSQGCSMVLRWANQFERKVNSIVLWAGFFANGLSDMIELRKLEGVNCKYVYGNKDEFLVSNPDAAKAFQKEIKESKLFEVVTFDGTHRVPNEVLREVYGNT